jgi:hypothetical protein
MSADRTIAVDDLLTQRCITCVGCRRKPEYLDFAFVTVNELVLLTARCVYCRKDDPTMAKLMALLERRSTLHVSKKEPAL